MRLTKTFWIVLGVAVLIAAAVTLYMFYQGQTHEQDELNDSLTAVHTELQRLDLEKGALEEEIAQLESDLAELEGETDQLEAEISQLEAELSQLMDERAQAVAQAELLLSQVEAEFLSLVESIEYDEVLFGFAHDNNLAIENIGVSGPSDEGVEGITYNTTTFTITVWGDVADMLAFVDTIVAHESFKTAVLDAFSMNVPEAVTDEEIAEIAEAIRAELTAEAIAEITTEEIVEYMIEAVVEVVGDDAAIETQPIEEVAQAIRDAITGLIEDEYVNFVAIDLSQLIEEHIAGSIVSEMLKPVVEALVEAILGEGEIPKCDLEKLLGEDIADKLGDVIEGALPGDIEGLLNEYVSDLVEAKMMALIEADVNATTDTMVAEIVEEMETPSSDITLVIYTYEGE
jgi:cell division protein FtsB